eukprot:944003-Rhodomonas_salina.1
MRWEHLAQRECGVEKPIQQPAKHYAVPKLLHRCEVFMKLFIHPHEEPRSSSVPASKRDEKRAETIENGQICTFQVRQQPWSLVQSSRHRLGHWWRETRKPTRDRSNAEFGAMSEQTMTTTATRLRQDEGVARGLWVV